MREIKMRNKSVGKPYVYAQFAYPTFSFVGNIPRSGRWGWWMG